MRSRMPVVRWFQLGLLLVAVCASCQQSRPTENGPATSGAVESREGAGVPAVGPASEVATHRGADDATVRHAVNTVAFSPDGARLAVGDAVGNITLHDIAGNVGLWSIALQGSVVHDLAFAPDGRIVAAGADGRTSVLAAGDGTVTETFQDHAGGVRCTAVTRDGKWLLSASGDGRILTRSLVNGDVQALGRPDQPVTSLAVSRDGMWAASAGLDQPVRLWNLTDMTAGPVLEGHGSGVVSIDFSPHGDRLVSAGADGQILIRSIPAGEPVATFLSVDGRINTVLFALDGEHVITGAETGMVSLLSVGDGAVSASVMLSGAIKDLALSPDGSLIVAATADGAAMLLRLDEDLTVLGTVVRGRDVVAP